MGTGSSSRVLTLPRASPQVNCSLKPSSLHSAQHHPQALWGQLLQQFPKQDGPCASSHPWTTSEHPRNEAPRCSPASCSPGTPATCPGALPPMPGRQSRQPLPVPLPAEGNGSP